MSVPSEFVPEITAFSCSYCGYMAADTAGALRLEYPANVKLVRLPCTGKTDVHLMPEAGADAAYVIACSLGTAITPRQRTRQGPCRTPRLLKTIGLEPERLEMYPPGVRAPFAEIARQCRIAVQPARIPCDAPPARPPPAAELPPSSCRRSTRFFLLFSAIDALPARQAGFRTPERLLIKLDEDTPLWG
jgi:coenzyme F420-reducing hydrogenase delta subunit